MKIGNQIARAAAVLCAVNLLVGCAWLYADDTDYGATAFQQFTYNGTDWKIADRPAQGSLLIVADPMKTAGLGTLAGERFTTPERAPIRREYEAVVHGWFAATGRTCDIADGSGLDNQAWSLGDGNASGSQTWEFHYRCDWLP